MNAPEIPLIAIFGPTASGKSALAIEVARRVGGEIVGCDAMQIYRECDIVTAKPTLAEIAAVPHHLIDMCAPDEPFSAAQWASQARAAIEAIRARGHVPIVCGGTGFYARALLQPERLSAPAPDDVLRAQLEARLESAGAQSLLDELGALEPEIAQKLEVRDRYRVVRALQIALQRARGDAVATPPAPLDLRAFALSWPRETLYRRINMRVDAMLDAGALDETRALLDKWGRDTAWASGVGYAQLLEVLGNQLSLEDAVLSWKRESRRYAKRQETWFRHQSDAVWLDATRDLGELAAEVCEF